MRETVSRAIACTIRIPIVPDRRLATNRARGKSQWTLGPITAASREAAFRATESWCVATGEDMPHFADPVTVTVLIYWGKSLKMGKAKARVEQDRRLDWDSATTICKPMIDGALVDTGILNDDRQIVGGMVLQEVDPNGEGYTEIRLMAAGEDVGGVWRYQRVAS